MKARASNAARADLREIVTYIARDNPRAAVRIRQSLQMAIQSLREHPERGRIVGTRGDRPLRRLVVRPYLVFNVVLDREVLVTRVLRGDRDIEAEISEVTALPGKSG